MNKSPLNGPIMPIVASATPRHLTLAVLTAAVFAVGISGCSQPEPIEQNAPEYGLVTTDDANEDISTYVLPQDTSILDEPNADEIFYGKRLLNETKRLLPDNVGAEMNCNSCHIAQGKIPLAIRTSTAITTTRASCRALVKKLIWKRVSMAASSAL